MTVVTSRPAPGQATATRRTLRRIPRRLLPGDRWIWVTALAVTLLGLALVAGAMLKPRELFLGSNSVSARADVVEIPADGQMCIKRQRVPAGTGRVRFKLDSQTRRQPPYRLTVRLADGRRLAGRLPGAAPGFRYVDVPLDEAVPGSSSGFQLADVCLRIGDTGGAVYPWGTNQLGITDKPARVVDAKGHVREFPNRVAMWYLPKAHAEKSFAAQLPQIFARASLFRPAFVGPWLFWVLFLGVFPALVYAAVRLLATAGRRRSTLRACLAVGAIGFGVAFTWALVTPAFQSPDESEHFGAVQWFGETGKASDSAQGKRIQWSSDEALAIDATRELSVIERPEAKLPWLDSYEKAYYARIAQHGRPPQDDGGGFHPVISVHSPLYYAIESPGYLVAKHHSVFAQLLGMRLIAALMAGLTALFAALIVRELLPRQPVLAVAGGLLVAFEPMFSFIGGAVNNDNGVNLLAAATLFLAIRALRRGLTPGVAVALGVALAVTPLMKGTGYAIYPSILLAVGGCVIRRRSRATLLGLAAFLVGFFAIYLGWDAVRESFGRTQFTTPGGGTPGASFSATSSPRAYLVWLWQVLIPIRLPFMQDFTIVKWPFYNIYVERGFGSYGWYAIQFPKWVYETVVAVMAVVGAAGVASLWRFRGIVTRRVWEVAVLVSLPIVVFCGVEAAYFTLAIPLTGTAEQGRYIFTAIGALAAIVTLSTLVWRSRAKYVLTGLVCGLAVLTFAGQLLSLTTFYA